MKLLHIDSSILGENSVSRELSQATVAHLRHEIPNLEITYRDLATTPIPHLTGATFAAGLNPDVRADGAMTDDLALSDILLSEFLAADIVVIGIGFYNLTVPTQLKAWIDRIVVLGKTFRYGEHGVVGLATEKRLILAVARGGMYGPGSPMALHEHAETYVRSIFSLIGIAEIQVIAAEGVAMGPEPRAASIRAAHAAVDQLQTA